MTTQTDPVLEHARREGIIIAAAWLASTVYCCAYCYLYGYNRPGQAARARRTSGRSSGCPRGSSGGSWSPGPSAALFTFWFAGFYMADDDLGKDHTAELRATSAKGAGHE